MPEVLDRPTSIPAPPPGFVPRAQAAAPSIPPPPTGFVPVTAVPKPAPTPAIPPPPSGFVPVSAAPAAATSIPPPPAGFVPSPQSPHNEQIFQTAERNLLGLNPSPTLADIAQKRIDEGAAIPPTPIAEQQRQWDARFEEWRKANKPDLMYPAPPEDMPPRPGSVLKPQANTGDQPETPQQSLGQDLKNVPANIGAGVMRGVGGLAGAAGAAIQRPGQIVRQMGAMFPTTDAAQTQTRTGIPAKPLDVQAGQFAQRQGGYAAEGAAQTERDYPVQGTAGKLLVGAGTLGVDAAMSTLVGPTGFVASFAGRSAGTMYVQARSQGDDEQTAAGKALIAGFTAAVTPQLAHILPPQVGQEIATQAARAYLGTGGMVAAQAVADELTLKSGTTLKVDLSHVFPEAAVQGLIGLAMHGGHSALGAHQERAANPEPFAPPAGRGAEAPLTRPEDQATPALQAGDYGAGLGKVPDLLDPVAQAEAPNLSQEAAKPPVAQVAGEKVAQPVSVKPVAPDQGGRNEATVFKDGERLRATVTTVENDGGYEVKRIKLHRPDGTYEVVDVPPGELQNAPTSGEAREAIFQYLESKYPPPRELPPAKDLLSPVPPEVQAEFDARQKAPVPQSGEVGREAATDTALPGKTQGASNGAGEKPSTPLSSAEQGAKQPWQMHVGEFLEDRYKNEPDVTQDVLRSAMREHEQAVSRAIADGKPVPPDVRAEYPTAEDIRAHFEKPPAPERTAEPQTGQSPPAERQPPATGEGAPKSSAGSEVTAEPGKLSIEPYGQGLRIIRAGPKLTALKENWEGKSLAKYNSKAEGWIFSAKNEAELRPILDKINSEAMPKPTAKEVKPEAAAKPTAKYDGPSAPKDGGGDYAVDPSLLGGILQHSDTEAIYRAGDAKAEDHASVGMLGSASQRLKAGYHYLIDGAKRYSGKMFPTVSRLSEGSGEAAAHYVASKIYAKEAGPITAREILGKDRATPKGAEHDKLVGAALVQDNLDSIERGFRQQASEAENPGDRARFEEMAANVGSLIGAKGSPFATRTDFALALQKPEVRSTIARYKEWFAGEPEEDFRVSQGIGPEEERPSRGDITGARVNLKAILPEDPQTATTVRSANRGNPTNPRSKPSPFARQAKGNAPAYEISLSAMIENTLGKGKEIANQHRMYQQLVRDGIAKIGDAGQRPEIGGKTSIPFEVESARRFVATATGADGERMTKTFGTPAKRLYIRADAYQEIRKALNVDEPLRIPILTQLSKVANTGALASLSEAAYHIGNQISALARTPGTGLILPGMIKRMIQLWKADPEVARRLADLAKMGALKNSHDSPSTLLGKINPMNWGAKLINATDRAGRLLMDDAFSKLAEKGLVKDTEANRRDLINQFGQYNQRAQSRIISWARDLGFSPFATAGTNFWALGLKNMLAFSPGVKASSIPNAIALRAMVLGRFAVPLAMVGIANYLKWGRVDGSANLPVGSLRLDDDKDGKMRSVDVGSILGLTRGLRASGALAGIEGLRRGETGSAILDKAVGDVGSAAIAPFAGPLARLGKIAFTGSDFSGFQVAHTAEKNGSQTIENIKAAGKSFNPLIDLATGGHNSQLGRFAVKTSTKPDQSDAEMIADRLSRDNLHGMKLSELERAKHEARQELVAAIRKAPDDATRDKLIKDAKSKGVILGFQDKQVRAQAQRSAFADKVHGPTISAEEAMQIWNVATPKQREEIKSIVLAKIRDNKSMKPEDKGRLVQRVLYGG